MSLTRREFVKDLAVTGTTFTVLGDTVRQAAASEAPQLAENAMGVLVDLPRCIGCRRCEYACREAAGFSPPPVETFNDTSVFEQSRRPYPRSHTVINRYPNPEKEDGYLYSKVNCLHCVDPACVSACLVGALSKRSEGPVVYNPSRCMGCRYCMVACPFEIPTYDYDMPLTPQVRKCNLCSHIVPERQDVPACVRICPEEVMTYGRRADLLQLARQKIERQPDVYMDHIYGEHEAGGTSWLYLSSVPFENIGFKYSGTDSPARLTEAIQHGVFKKFLPPLMLFGFLGAVMGLTRPEGSRVFHDDDGIDTST